jgi:hypothetical protein
MREKTDEEYFAILQAQVDRRDRSKIKDDLVSREMALHIKMLAALCKKTPHWGAEVTSGPTEMLIACVAETGPQCGGDVSHVLDYVRASLWAGY